MVLDLERVAELLAFVPPEAAVFFVATTPILELRGAIPLGVVYYSMSPLEAFAWAFAGNLVPVVLLLYLLEPVSLFLRRRSNFFDRFFDWLFSRTRDRVEDRYRRYGALALTPLVAVPLPVTGAWTACAAAFVFDVPRRYAFPAIAAGVFAAGVVVTSAVTGGAWILA